MNYDIQIYYIWKAIYISSPDWFRLDILYNCLTLYWSEIEC